MSTDATNIPQTETAPTPTPRRNSAWVSLAIVTAIAAIVFGGYLLAPTPSDPDAERFAGTDSVAVDVSDEWQENYEPWFSPVIELESSEVESGLFAFQAALGAGFLGYVFGRLRSRRS